VIGETKRLLQHYRRISDLVRCPTWVRNARESGRPPTTLNYRFTPWITGAMRFTKAPYELTLVVPNRDPKK
jgi:hypothetical protein